MSWSSDVTTTINSNRTLSLNNIYNNNTANVWIWTTSPQKKLEIHTTDENNLLLRRNSTTISHFAGLRFWVNNFTTNVQQKAWIFFERLGSSWIGALHFALNNEQDNSNASLSNKIMTIKHAWNTWAVWVLTDDIQQWVALEINDTMRLKPRLTQPFVCDESKEWSIFFYKTEDASYPCYCWYTDKDSAYKWHHTNGYWRSYCGNLEA